MRSVVRVHSSPLAEANARAHRKDKKQEKQQKMAPHPWGCSSVGRAPALQAGGQEFESLHLHLIIQRAAVGLTEELFQACLDKASQTDQTGYSKNILNEENLFSECSGYGVVRSTKKLALFIPELLTDHNKICSSIRMYLENRIQKRKFFLKYLRERHPRRLPRGNHKT